MSELKYNLRKGVEVWKKQKEILKERLAWNAISYLSSIDHNSVFAPVFVEEDLLENIKKLLLNKQNLSIFNKSEPKP